MLRAVNLGYFSATRFLVKHIDLPFMPNAIHGILGPNGSGKTTLLKLLAGIWEPSEGTVLWHEENLLKKPRRQISQIISFIPQNPQIPFEFTVRQFLEMAFYSQNIVLSSTQRQDQIQDALNLVGAFQFLCSSIHNLSQGERQRIYVARALITQAPILVFDEPTANLDVKYQGIIWKLLKVLSSKNKTILISTHDFTACQHYCDFAHVLQRGSAIASGQYSQVMTPALYHSVFEK